MPLDLAVSRAVAAASRMECAVHDTGPWQMEIQGVRVPAVRQVLRRTVIFTASFPDVCFLSPPELVALICRDEPVSVRALDIPHEGSFPVEWEFTVTEPETTLV